MFIVLLTYKKPLDVVDQYIPQHVAFLNQAYQDKQFIVSGRKNPRTGGVILSNVKNRVELEGIIKQDPFHVHDIADYEIIEFLPSKYQSGFEPFL